MKLSRPRRHALADALGTRVDVDLLVVGRAVTAAPDPRAALAEYVATLT